MPTTFNTDICSLALVHYADNNHHSCRGPTFEKNVCLEVMLAKMLKALLRGFGKKVITLFEFKISENFFILWKEEIII